MGLTEFKHDGLSPDHLRPRYVGLSDRDIADAKRILGRLSASGPCDNSNVTRSVYERLKGEGWLLQRANRLVALRQRREKIFGKAMFGEPAWDILLVLYTAGGGVSMSRLAQMSGHSQATGLRWMNYLVDQRLITRESHPNDARSFRVLLTDKGKASLESYLSVAVELGED
jgi:DNA-binding MarR family transcriptional regulator